MKKFDDWNEIKKQIEKRQNINFKDDKNIKFRINSYSLWWYEVGENIGTETSCHYSKDKDTFSSLRPCVVISSNRYSSVSYHKKVIIMPLTSKKEKIKYFHYELKSKEYKKNNDKNIVYKGLGKDSFVICNDIKSIDTKRLIEPIYKKLHEKDIENLKGYISEYFMLPSSISFKKEEESF